MRVILMIFYFENSSNRASASDPNKKMAIFRMIDQFI